MKKVNIKHNPYQLKTEIIVDGNPLAENSTLRERADDGSRLQEWVEILPQLLIDEYNDTNFEIEFHGTLLDFEDLHSIFDATDNSEKITVKLQHIPAKETSDKEVLIDEVFEEIKKGPFDELRSDDVINAFNHAKSSDFEVCVVATMSAGKSTLINAMLNEKLMPSKQGACTAKITKIKDISNEKIPFKASVYDTDGCLKETQEQLTNDIMERLNSDETISKIDVVGNIPFVESEEVSLVLIDTPGPNNSRDPRHKKVQSELLSKSSKALILYIMTGEFGTTDDNELLQHVSESMAVGGKQSKDRFLFIINKQDQRKEEDGDTSQTLDRVRCYLKTHGIDNPNLFPAGALPALTIRLMEYGESPDYDTEYQIKKLNRNEYLHFEKYATLPASIKNQIEVQLEATQANWEGPIDENPEEALIHSGVISIEAAIRQYVEKYAKTAKVKNIVDTFIHKLDEIGCYEKTKQELAQNTEKKDQVIKQIEIIEMKINGVTEGKKFKDAVDNAVVSINNDSQVMADIVIEKFQSQITDQLSDLRGQELSVDEAKAIISTLQKFAEKLEPEFEVELDQLIRINLLNTGSLLIEEYKAKLEALTEELDIDTINGVTIDPLKLMGGSIVPNKLSVNKLTKNKSIENGEEWVENTDKKWYKPWTWLQEKGYWRKQYQDVKYVQGDELSQTFLAPIEKGLYENRENACQYALKQSEQIARQFNHEFERLDEVLKDKLQELKSFVSDKEKADERIKESKEKLIWLEQIRTKVESILEI